MRIARNEIRLRWRNRGGYWYMLGGNPLPKRVTKFLSIFVLGRWVSSDPSKWLR